VESTISLSERDLARGAIDLTPEHDLPVNNTLLETAVSVIKDAGPKIIEVISNHLVPALPKFPEVFVNPRGAPVSRDLQGDLPVPEVMVSPPVETIVVISPPNQTSQLPPNMTADTVI
jgi:hypothetical protein